MQIDNLGEKLRLLFDYRVNPDIQSQTALGKALAVTKTAVTNWINEGSLPDRHVRPVCELFLISEALLLEKTLGVFERRLQQSREDLYVDWQRLLELAEPSEALQLIRIEPVEQETAALTNHRGIAESFQPEAALEHLKLGERFRIGLQCPPGWHIVLLFRDMEGLHCLRPSEVDPNNIIGPAGEYTVPAGAKYFYAKRPEGQHTLVAVLKRTAWSPSLYHHLQSAGRLPEAIVHIMTSLKATSPKEWTVIKKEFFVG